MPCACLVRVIRVSKSLHLVHNDELIHCITPMASSFELLPQELIEQIATLLSLDDVCKLRFTNRTIYIKASQGCFRTYFLYKCIDIQENFLQNFVYITQVSELCRLVQSITFDDSAAMNRPIDNDGDVRMTDINNAITECKSQSAAQFLLKQPRANEASSLLSQALSNLRHASEMQNLRSISLNISHRDTGGWKLAWNRAAAVFYVVMRAIVQSKTQIECLDLFSSVVSCSLSCDMLTPWLTVVSGYSPFSTLKHLRMSLSRSQIPTDAIDAAATLQHTHKAFKLLALAPRLESLFIHWFTLSSFDYRKDPKQRAEEFFLDGINDISPTVQFLALKACTIQGIRTNPKDLLSFFGRMPALYTLTVEELHLKSETANSLKTILDSIPAQLPQLNTLHLSDLYAPSLIRFNDPAATSGKMLPDDLGHPYMGGQYIFNQNALSRVGSAVRIPIDFSADNSEVWGTRHVLIRNREVSRHYGHW